MEERRSGRHQLSEVQSLLEVARREQAKTALHLQRTERKVCSVCFSGLRRNMYKWYCLRGNPLIWTPMGRKKVYCEVS